jgi:hypothetical protein
MDNEPTLFDLGQIHDFVYEDFEDDDLCECGECFEDDYNDEEGYE